jgi:hypothetical protein
VEHIRRFNEGKKDKWEKFGISKMRRVYYLVFNDFDKDEQEILREFTEASQNGYADLICVGEDDEERDIDRLLIDKGFSVGDEVVIHYKW